MPRFAWLTDIHLNFLEPMARSRFYDQVNQTRPDTVWLTGDVAESPDLVSLLEELAAGLVAPVYFVLGNHDYYFSSISEVRAEVDGLCQRDARLHYLTHQDAVEIAPGVGLVGHDGWADARLGDYQRSLVMMHDYKLIRELASVDKAGRWPLLQALGDEAATAARAKLLAAATHFREIFFLTHVPPFAESCMYDGRPSNEEWLPHFSSWAMGQMLRNFAGEHPQMRVQVLCGHTHGQSEFHPLANLAVFTGGAEYGKPAVARVWEIGT